MAGGLKKPSIRFAGFTAAWEQRGFSSIAFRRSEMTAESGLPRVEYEDIIPEVGILNKDLSEKNSDKQGIGFYVGDVLYGKLRPYLHNWLLPSFNGIAVGDFWVLESQDADSKFLYRLVQSSKFDEIVNQSTGTKMPRADWKLISKTQFSIPCSIEEQEQIGTYFENLDLLITLHQRKHDKLVNLKKSMLEKMFPQEGTDVPEIRFAGFTNAWKLQKLAEIAELFQAPVPTPHEGYWRLGIKSHAKGTFHNFVLPGKELVTAQMHKVSANKLIVNITFAWEHAVAITDENDAEKLVSHRFPQFSLSDEIDPNFFKYIILDDKFRHCLWLASPGSAGRNRVLKIQEMLKYEVKIPIKQEQEKIAFFLKHLDSLISLHQRKLEKLQNIKKSCLEKMFV